MTRAIKGGEIGMNGEAYEGGQFLPNTTLGKMGKKARAAATRKVEIAPYTYEIAPEGKSSIYRRIAGTTAQWKVFGKEFQPFWPYLSQQSQEAQDEAVKLIALWNAGERWI